MASEVGGRVVSQPRTPGYLKKMMDHKVYMMNERLRVTLREADQIEEAARRITEKADKVCIYFYY